MNHQANWSWIVNGLGGLITIIERLSEHPLKAGPDQTKLMEEAAERLLAVVQKEKDKPE